MKTSVLVVVMLFVLGCHSESTDRADAVQLHEKAFKLYVDNKYAEALPIFKEAAAKGSADAECELGIMYELGQGVDIDFTKAMNGTKNLRSMAVPAAFTVMGSVFTRGSAPRSTCKRRA